MQSEEQQTANELQKKALNYADGLSPPRVCGLAGVLMSLREHLLGRICDASSGSCSSGSCSMLQVEVAAAAAAAAAAPATLGVLRKCLKLHQN